jgi:hypothetical protein
MGEDGRAVFEKFKHLPASIGANQVRIHLVDDIVRRKLREYPDLLILLLGAGFDTRALRMRGGLRLRVRRNARYGPCQSFGTAIELRSCDRFSGEASPAGSKKPGYASLRRISARLSIVSRSDTSSAIAPATRLIMRSTAILRISSRFSGASI